MVVMYNAVRRLDFSEYIHWFVLAWTFVGLEMVALTWFLSMVIFVPLAVVSVFLVRRWSKREIPAS
jgi:membrane protein implicated in regulation of membrane protease activity